MKHQGRELQRVADGEDCEQGPRNDRHRPGMHSTPGHVRGSGYRELREVEWRDSNKSDWALDHEELVGCGTALQRIAVSKLDRVVKVKRWAGSWPMFQTPWQSSASSWRDDAARLAAPRGSGALRTSW